MGRTLWMMRSSFGGLRRIGQARVGSTSTGPLFEYRPQSDDDPTLRKTCTRCGFVQYQNPKIVCGSVLTVNGETVINSQSSRSDVRKSNENEMFVLGRRTIEPRRGFWGIPAGFMEMGETIEQGAAREATEELNAHVDIGGLLAVYSLPHIGQIQMIYSSVLKSQVREGGCSSDPASEISAGQETDKVSLFRWEHIPWDKLAFPTTSWALLHHRQRSIGKHLISSTDQLKPLHGESLRGTEHSLPLDGRHERQRAAFQEGFISAETVFTAPGDNTALFWCPRRGLHVKDGWSSSTDS